MMLLQHPTKVKHDAVESSPNNGCTETDRHDHVAGGPRREDNMMLLQHPTKVKAAVMWRRQWKRPVRSSPHP